MPGNRGFYEEAVMASILGKSVEKERYDVAKREWEFTGTVDDHGPIHNQMGKTAHCQLCGHEIRYGYILANRISGARLEVGSECIGNYLEITPQVAGRLESAKKAAVARERKKVSDIAKAAIWAAATVRGAVLNAMNAAGGLLAPKAIRDDYNRIVSVTNNAAVLWSRIEDGTLFELAQKYGVTLRMDYINAFVELVKSRGLTKKDLVKLP